MKKKFSVEQADANEGVFSAQCVFPTAGVKALLSLLVAHKNASRLVLERFSSLSRATIVQWLGALLAARIVQETNETQASGGSPSRLLKIKEDFSLMIAVDIGERLTRVALTSLVSQTLLEMSFPTDLEKPPKAVLSAIMAHTQALLARLGRPKSEVLGLGLSLPAPIDFASGRVFGPFALVDNDGNLMALAEQRNFWPEEAHFFSSKPERGSVAGF